MHVLLTNSVVFVVQAAKIVKQVYSVIPVYDKIIPAILTGGVWNLPKKCNFSPGVPVGPMLAKPTKGVSEIVDKFHDMEFTCEYKYDGERAQVIERSFSDFFFSYLFVCSYICGVNRSITWRMVQLRYIVEMLKEILESFLM